MKSAAVAFVAFASILCPGCNPGSAGSPAESGPSLEGRWEGSWQYADGSYVEKITFDLAESGSKITGSGMDEKGVAAKISGEAHGASFSLLVVPENGTDPIVFAGRLDKSCIEGEWSVGRVKGPWSAKKTATRPPPSGGR